MSAARFSILGTIGRGLVRFVLIGALLWAAGAVWFDLPIPVLHTPLPILLVVLALVAGLVLRFPLAVLLLSSVFAIVLIWWLSLEPSNDRPWQPDVAQTPWAEINGDHITLHNVRNCDYRTETDYTPRWETRTVDLSQLTALDLAINYWGSEWMAHPIASFEFADAAPVCFSIETRKELGESYSAVGGLYRQYELVYVCADERDVLRVRTNYRQGEDVYFYRINATPEGRRQRFLDYVNAMNVLHERPKWYNAATTNCTTTIRTQHTATSRSAWDWRILFNGYADQMLYERGALAGGLPFAELKQKARINDAAKAADAAPDFSARIRADRPGFNPAAAKDSSR